MGDTPAMGIGFDENVSVITPGGHWIILKVTQIWVAGKSPAAKGGLVEEPIGVREGGFTVEPLEGAALLVGFHRITQTAAFEAEELPKEVMAEDEFQRLLNHISGINEDCLK